MLVRIFTIFMLLMFFSNNLLAETYIREYTYHASEADSKLSSRTISLQEVKRELLNELGTHITSLINIRKDSDGSIYGEDDIVSLSAGFTSVEILDERWDGKTYYLKAQLKADPKEVLKSIDLLNERESAKRRAGDAVNRLKTISEELLNTANALRVSNIKTTEALVEIGRLKKKLAKSTNEQELLETSKEYQKQIAILNNEQWMLKGIQAARRGDYQSAFKWNLKGANQGNTDAQMRVALAYKEGLGVEEDIEKFGYWFMKSEASGGGASNAMGDVMFMKQDFSGAKKMYENAAKKGHAGAQCALGLMYYVGLGVTQNKTTAIAFFLESAKNGNMVCQLELGEMYYHGRGVQKDQVKALYWFEKSARQGVKDAQLKLGKMYYHGDGIQKDRAKAAYWIEEQAKLGDHGAQFNIGLLYFRGEGVQKNYELAFKWLKKSAIQGNALAQHQIGKMYLSGEGLNLDRNKAEYWLKKAADLGDEPAIELLKSLD